MTDPTTNNKKSAQTNDSKTPATPAPKAFVPTHRPSPIAAQSFKSHKGGPSFNKPMARRAARGR